MNNYNYIESKFWKILTKDHLVDLSQFHKVPFFDEVPLFARESDLAFLSEYTSEQVNTLLLRFALKFLQSVVSYEEHRAAFFAAITAWSFATSDPLIPNLFVWSGPMRRLEKRLRLDEATTPLGRKIKSRVLKLGLRDRFEVLEDRSGTPGGSHVFISYSEPPYPRFVPIGTFRKARSQAAGGRHCSPG
jgi:hypothetical protein